MINFSEVANGRGLLVACEGDLDLRDMYEARKDLIDGNPAIGYWYFAIVDLSSVLRLEVTAPAFDRLIEQDRKISQVTRPGLPIAVLARTELPFGISRMWEAATDFTGWETQVFRERSAAEAWLRYRVLALYDVELPSTTFSNSSAAAI
jgi:hypothetical protein